MISLYTGSNVPLIVDVKIVWAYLAIYFAITLALYLLRSIGLFTLAKRQNVKCARLSWVPFVWFYVACKLVGNARFFNKPIEKIAIILTVIFAVSEFLTFASQFLTYYPIFGNMIAQIGDWAIGFKPEGYTNAGLLIGDIYYKGQIYNPYGSGGLLTISNVLYVLDYINLPLGLVSLFVEITVYMGLFRKFIPQHYMLFMILSVLVGIFAPLVFAIRKRNAVNYMDYIRSRYQYNQYNNPYNRGGYNNNPYANPYNNPYGNMGAQQAPPKNPFEEFESRDKRDPGNPFEEFDRNKNEDDK